MKTTEVLISEIRAEIDKVDTDLLRTIKKRNELVLKIANLKRQDGIASFQEQRFLELKKKWSEHASEFFICSSFAMELLDCIHRNALILQIRHKLLNTKIALEKKISENNLD